MGFAQSASSTKTVSPRSPEVIETRSSSEDATDCSFPSKMISGDKSGGFTIDGDPIFRATSESSP